MKSSSAILFLASEYLPVRGGIARYSADMVHLLAQDHDVELMVWRPVSRDPVPEQPRVSVTYSSAMSVQTFWDEVMARVESGGVKAVCLGHLLFLHAPPKIRLRKKKIPAYVFIYGADVKMAMGKVFWAKRYLALMTGVCVRPISRSSDRLFRRRFPWVKSSIILPGIFLDDGANQKQLCDLQGRSGILWVGRLVRRKGADVLIQAFAQIADQFPEQDLTICGDGPERERLLEIAATSGCEERIHFLTNESRESIFHRMRSARVFCQLPRIEDDGDIEGFGIVFIEAASQGLPCVAGASGGVLDAVMNGRSGYLVEPTDVNMVSEKLTVCLSDGDQWDTLSRGALDWAREISWTQRTGRTEFPELYVEQDATS